MPKVNHAAVGYAISSAREKSSRHDSLRDNILQDFSLALEMTHNPASLALINGSLLDQRRQGTVAPLDYAITAPASALQRKRTVTAIEATVRRLERKGLATGAEQACRRRHAPMQRWRGRNPPGLLK